jgi:subtilisin-like proprotein convertase family protein
MKNFTLLVSSTFVSIFMLGLQTSNAAPFSFAADDLPTAIVQPDSSGAYGKTVSTITVPSGGGVATINDLNVFVDLDHTYTADLIILIKHAETGTTAMLFNRYGGSGNDITNVTFDDEGSGGLISSSSIAPPYGPGSFVPYQSLDAFDTESVEGTWTLTVYDISSGDGGTLYSFGIEGDASTADSDGDGVDDTVDLCPDTRIPEATVPSVALKQNRYALVGGTHVFNTAPPPGKGNIPGGSFTTAQTDGCSCEQILDSNGFGEGNRKFGCSTEVMKQWIGGITH